MKRVTQDGSDTAVIIRFKMIISRLCVYTDLTYNMYLQLLLYYILHMELYCTSYV